MAEVRTETRSLDAGGTVAVVTVDEPRRLNVIVERVVPAPDLDAAVASVVDAVAAGDPRAVRLQKALLAWVSMGAAAVLQTSVHAT